MNTESGHEGTTNKDAGVEARTVFVRNLPYTFTDYQLQEVFSEIGPVRRSFTIKEKGAEQHRGFGYVQFAVADDAIRAVQAKDGTDLHGRKVMVKLAKRRPAFEQRRTKKQPNGKPITGESERLGTSELEKKAPQKPPFVSTIVEKQGLKSAGKESALDAQRTKNSQHESKRVNRKRESSCTTVSEEVPPPKKAAISRQIEKQEPFDAKLNGRGVAVDAQRKQKGQSDSGGNKKIKKDLSKPAENKSKDEAFGNGKSSEKQRVARTVILGGLVSPEMREAVIECAKKVGPVESMQSSLSAQELKGRGLEKDGCKVGAAAIVYTSVKAASQAVAELHQRTIGDGIVWARQLGGEGSKPRKWRIIVRNLPFSITEEQIRELFASSGFVWEAKVPRKDDGQARGFAFASFTSKSNAEKAIRHMNGRTVQKRPIAVDWAVERSAYEPNISEVQSKDDTKELPFDMEDETASEDEEHDFIKEDESFYRGFENECGVNELPTSFEEIDLAKKVLHKVVSASLDVKLESAESKRNGCDLFKSNGGLTSAKEEKRPHTESKPADEDHNTQVTSREDLTRTVFIKNLPFDVDSDTLKGQFSEFGKVKSTYLVLHPKTKRPKGTAFLEFSTTESAEAALAAAIGTTDDKKFAAGISIGGRKLEVLNAVGKKAAEALEKEKIEHSIVDRRNLYLAKEGKIEEGTAAANGVSEQDMQRRRQLEQVKATKLRSPNFHVSRTRLVVYNVPKSMNEAEVRKLFKDAVKSRATKQNPVIKQVKILRDEDKGEKSRGVAFVEFTEHQHALVAVRVLNNNPVTFSPERRPIVGFAIENLQTLKMRHEQQLAAGKRGGSKFKEKRRREKNLKPSKIRDIDGSVSTIGEQGAAGIKGVDESGGGKLKEKKRREKKLRVSRSRESDGSVLLTSEQCKLDAKVHSNLDLNDERPAKPSRRSKLRASVTHHEQANVSGVKRKKREDANLDQDLRRVQKKPSFKRLELSKKKLKWKELEESKNDSFLKNKGRLKNKADSSTKKINGADSWTRRQNATSDANAHQKMPKDEQRKKGSKFEVEDKLEKLVATYREKYFADASGGAKAKKRSASVVASNDLKRWFE